MEKKLRVIRFIPSIVVQYPSGYTYLETSSCLYEDLSQAQDMLERLIKIYGRSGKILRSSVVRKVVML